MLHGSGDDQGLVPLIRPEYRFLVTRHIGYCRMGTGRGNDLNICFAISYSQSFRFAEIGFFLGTYSVEHAIGPILRIAGCFDVTLSGAVTAHLTKAESTPFHIADIYRYGGRRNTFLDPAGEHVCAVCKVKKCMGGFV